MNSLIKETNENLKIIIDTMKENLELAINNLDNIQAQMDRKVEEAKKYKILVDTAKARINDLDEDNRSLELSLKELNDKYGKMNLVSVIEAGNKEIKSKINDNLREISKQKEQIAELTNKARTIKDLLINLKKDKTIKEERLENLKVVCEYYTERLSDVIDYAFNHSENLSDYSSSSYISDSEDNVDVEIDDKDLENTMVFDEIANIDENRNFKDEMSFISEQIDNDFTRDTEVENIQEDSEMNDLEESIFSDFEINDNEPEKTFDMNSFEEENSVLEDVQTDDIFGELEIKEDEIVLDNYDEENKTEDDFSFELASSSISEEEPFIPSEDEVNEELSVDESKEEYKTLNMPLLETEEFNDIKELSIDEDKYLDEENEERLNKINSLFSTLNGINVSPLESPLSVNNIDLQVDNAYENTFGQPIDVEFKTESNTLTDIFGNPIKKEEVVEEVKDTKSIEDLFIENGVDFNKFKDDEKSYLKEIYNEDNFEEIFNILKKNKINLDNVYNAFNIFGEISPKELENIVSKLLEIGQSVEAIGVILEKLPRVKKYNLDDAIASYGDYIKNIDITELIMKAKELYDGGNK